MFAVDLRGFGDSATAKMGASIDLRHAAGGQVVISPATETRSCPRQEDAVLPTPGVIEQQPGRDHG
ncbi:MAG: hypothetical protein J2P32_13315, partial [Actinobacteria bacterium]|nr:hypothetical protein [Actinomycetota bacterium]